MGTKVCVTVTGRTMAELIKRRDDVVDADLVELRLDGVKDPSAAGALAGRRVPVIITCRPRWEGGAFDGSEDERRRLLADAQQLGAEYVDLEWKADFREQVQARGGRGVVLSMHDFSATPVDLVAQADAMRRTGAEVVKLAVMAHGLSDCLALLPIARAATAPTVLIAMGDAGLTTRVLASRFASCWTYAGDDGVAPGQIPAVQMIQQYRVRELDAATALYGVIGRPIGHSLSPAMHNAAFAAARINAVYLPLAARDYDDFLRFADAMAICGASVTSPFKLAAFAQAETRDPVSMRVQSANTIRRTPRGWDACNTDVAGFLAPLEAGAVALARARATILGAGGAARAAAIALMSAGATVSISARRLDHGRAVADSLGCGVASYPPAPGSWDVLVNATPVGTAPAVEETPLAHASFTGDLVYDLVYNPLETRLLRDARAAGCRTIGGLEMLVAQAARQFAWWTAIQPSTESMRHSARTALGAASFSPFSSSSPLS